MSGFPKYQIGDRVWRAAFEGTAVYLTCPDCGGTGRLRIIFHDDTQASIECRNCQRGYNSPTGQVIAHERAPRVDLVTISGVEIEPNQVRYKVSAGEHAWYIYEPDQLFDNESDARACAQDMAAKADAKERAKVLTKEKDTRTWAWNASYHRQCIKRAQHDLEYHTAKLNVAAIKAKEKVPV